MTRKLVSTALTAVGCALALLACGSSGKTSGASAAGGPLLKLAECMRSHGVPNFPDPKTSGGLVIPSNINPRAPAFLDAQKACAKLGSGGTVSGSGASESAKLAMLTIARCMRRHGLPNFPDPTTSPPPPSAGNAIGGGGVFLSIGNSNSPAFKQAAAACGLRVP